MQKKTRKGELRKPRKGFTRFMQSRHWRKNSSEAIRAEVDAAPAATADVPADAPAPLPRTAPIYRRLLALAPAAGLDEDAATYIVGVRVCILHEYADQPDDVLADCLRAWARERPAMFARCGPVWLAPHWPSKATGCPWCARTRAGLPIPRPPFGRNQEDT